MATPHNNAPKGAFAKTVLMPGDPLRAKLIADNFLTDVKLVNNVRNIYGFTGLYNGKPVSVMASGMGMPSIGIYSHELYTQYDVENIIRIGSAGSYVERLEVQDVCLGKSAYSESSFVKVMSGLDDKLTYPSEELNAAIKAKAEELGIECKDTIIHSSDVFYTQPGRFDYKEFTARTGAECVEMESFSLFHIAKTLGKKAACLLTISDSFVSAKELTAEERQNSFMSMIKLALETAVSL